MKKGRREFLLTGAAVLPAALTLESLANAPAVVKSEGVLAQTHNFLIQPELFVRYDEKFGVVSTAPWGVAEEDLDLLPYVLGHTQFDLGDEAAGGGRGTLSSRTLERLSSFRLQGEIPVTDIVGDVSIARAGNRAIDLSLSFFDKLSGQKDSGAVSFGSGVLSVNTPQANNSLAPKAALLPSYVRIPIQVPFTKYLLQFRGPDTGHNMAPCAPEPRAHYHLEVQQIAIPKNKYLANFHIGIWRSGSQICFAIANSEGRPACFRKCTPSWTDIKNAVQQALVGIGISLAVAAAIAAVVATIMYGSLVLLAV
jgi:hypothetical protein